ncbi:hypothetical protein Syun_002131 [Stephania yunnanensis]|uniref:Uncharacterized protein n=1 Tax=Stephania yunnanensis TaxID=152371 RepID=A0AAP0QBJ8_9MAGN
MVAGKRYYGSNVAKADEKMAGVAFRHDLDYIMQTWLDEHRAKGDQMRGDAINNTRDFLDVLVMMEKSGQFSSAIKDIDTTIKALALTQLVAWSG